MSSFHCFHAFGLRGVPSTVPRKPIFQRISNSLYPKGRASLHGQWPPFLERPFLPSLEHMEEMEKTPVDVNDVVAAKVEAARVKIQAAKRRREELSTARRRGLAARYAAKLRAQAARRPEPTEPGAATPEGTQL